MRYSFTCHFVRRPTAGTQQILPVHIFEDYHYSVLHVFVKIIKQMPSQMVAPRMEWR